MGFRLPQDAEGVDAPAQAAPAPLHAAGLTVDGSAVARLAELRARLGRPIAVRVAVEGGGCSGFRYAIEADRAEEDDVVVEVEGGAFRIDPLSEPYWEGAVLRFDSGLAGSRFVIDNPVAASGCGCGVSFAV